MFKKRIIIGGLPRAGTTLLRYILDSSPDVISGPETGFFRRPLVAQKARLRRVVERVDRTLDLGVAELSRIIHGEQNSVKAFDEIMKKYSEKVGVKKDVWAEKTPRNCFSYHWLAEEDPELYFISLIRDGRDVVTSVLDGGDTYHCSIDRYVETLDSVYEFDLTKYKHLIIPYEDMVRCPERVFRNIFNFLELKFTQDILENYQVVSATRDSSKVRQSKVQHAITPKWIGRWGRPEHAARISEFMMDERAVNWLIATGYD